MNYDEQLTQLQEKIWRHRQLETMLKELRSQQETLSRQVWELEKIKLDEQADVERLEGRSLAAFFCHVIGKPECRHPKSAGEADKGAKTAGTRNKNGIERKALHHGVLFFWKCVGRTGIPAKDVI